MAFAERLKAFVAGMLMPPAAVCVLVMIGVAFGSPLRAWVMPVALACMVLGFRGFSRSWRSAGIVAVAAFVVHDKRLSPIQADGPRHASVHQLFGGSCFPKDVKALIAHGRKLGRDMRLLDAVVHVNTAQPTICSICQERTFRTWKECGDGLEAGIQTRER